MPNNKQKPIALFLILFCSALSIVNAQSPQADSLRRVLSSNPPAHPPVPRDSIYFRTLSALCRQYLNYFEIDSLSAATERGLALLETANDREGDASWREKVGKYKMSLSYFRATAYIENGEYQNALPYFQKYLSLAEKWGPPTAVGTAYNSIAWCHQSLEDYDLAYEYALKAQKALQNGGNKTIQAQSFIIIAEYFSQRFPESDSCIYYCKKAVNLAREAQNPVAEVKTTFSLIEFFFHRFQSDSALFYLEKIKPFIFEMNAPDQVLRYHHTLGRAYYELGNVRQAVRELSIANEATKEVDDDQTVFQVKKYLSLALAADGKYIPSLKCLEEAITAYSNDLDNEKVRTLNTAQLNADFAKKEALAQLELQKQKRIRDISIVGLFLGLLIALLIFRLYQQSRKTARMLKDKNNEIEQAYLSLKTTQEQLVLTEKQREAQSVRVRIARDIHDELGAGLTKITILSDVLRKKMAENQPENAQMLQRIAENSKGVSAALSEIVWAVNPAHDSLESLCQYLKNYAQHYLDGSGIDCILDFPTQVASSAVAPELKRNIFLVMKEALNNAVKYSNADTIRIAFQTDGRQFHLSIRDNGKGFDPDNPGANGDGGNGLGNMKTRMEQVGCQLVITASPGNGCLIESNGPVKNA